MSDLSQLLAFRDRQQTTGAPLLLVTIMRTAGSTYRKPGARLLLTRDGQHEGTISGGCLEADLLESAWTRLDANEGRPTMMRYDTTEEGEILWGTGTGCAGQVELLLEPLGADDPLAFLAEGRNSDEEVAIVTVLEHHAPAGIVPGDTRIPALGTRFCLRRSRSAFPKDLPYEVVAELRHLAERTIAEKRSSITQTKLQDGAELEVACEFVSVPPHIFVFGTGRDALPVVRLSKGLGWKVTVAGKKTKVGAAAQLQELADAFLTAEEALVLVKDDSLVLIMSHNFLGDLSVLEGLAQRSVRYIGLLGPKARREKLMSELERNRASWDRDQMDRLHAPAGLDIGAEGPAGIALSIVAEMQTVLAERSARPLRFRETPIYATQSTKVPR
jgi:xanthine/CO dehydrogenase XdhC/CoxF family maturation factor